MGKILREADLSASTLRCRKFAASMSGESPLAGPVCAAAVILFPRFSCGMLAVRKP